MRWRDVKQSKANNKQETIIKEDNSNPCASLFSRFKSFLTDSFLITTPITYLVIYLVLNGGEDFAQNRAYGWSLILGISAVIILFFWYVKQQTPGMKAYSLKIVTLKYQKITFLQAALRYIATLVSIVSIFLMFLPFLHKQKKSFQDLISRTIIIDE